MTAETDIPVTTVTTVTTSCYRCLRTITVPLELFEQQVVAFCRDAGRRCPGSAGDR